MVERLEDLVDYYLGSGDVTLDSLGRAGEKLKNLNAAAFTLPSFSKEFEFNDLASFLDLTQSSLIRIRTLEVGIPVAQTKRSLAQALPRTLRVGLTHKSCL